MRIKTLLFLAVVLGCAGCATLQKKPAVTGSLPPTVVPLAPVSGTDLDPANAEKVRLGESLKAYPVGRYVDPQDPDLMHEAHVVYRREAGAAWNLHPNAPTVVPLGPALAVAEPSRTPNPLPAELEQKMAEQNQLVASLIEQNEALSQELTKLGAQLAELRRQAASEEKKP